MTHATLNFGVDDGYAMGTRLRNYAEENFNSSDRISEDGTIIDVYEVERLAVVIRRNIDSGDVERGSVIGERGAVLGLIQKLNLNDSVE